MICIYRRTKQENTMKVERKPKVKNYDVMYTLRMNRPLIDRVKKYAATKDISVSDMIRSVLEKEMGERPIDRMFLR